MRKSNLAAKDLRAHKRLVAAAENLAIRFDLLVPDKLISPSGKSPVKRMRQRECVADLLEIIDELTAARSTVIVTQADEIVKLKRSLALAKRKAKKAKEEAGAKEKPVVKVKPEADDGSTE